jgi:hypothetical protein
VLPLGEAEGEDSARLEKLRRLPLDLLVIAHPDRPEAQDSDLPGIPVGKAVEAENLIELAVAPGVPAAVVAAVLGWCQKREEESLLLHEIEEVLIPDALVIVALDRRETLRFEEIDYRQHELATVVVGILADASLRV